MLGDKLEDDVENVDLVQYVIGDELNVLFCEKITLISLSLKLTVRKTASCLKRSKHIDFHSKNAMIILINESSKCDEKFDVSEMQGGKVWQTLTVGS